MDPKQTAKQMMELKKYSLDSTLNLMTLFQEQTEKMINLYLDQATFLPKEGKKMLTEWLTAAKTGREFFKKMVDDGCKTAESCFV